MKVIYTDEHRQRASQTELYGGELVPPFECPERMDHISGELTTRGHSDIIEPEDFGLDPILEIHTPDYVEFLKTCWRDWQAEGFKGEAIATAWPSRRMTRQTPPRNIDGRIGYYCLASETSISAPEHGRRRMPRHRLR